MPEDVALPGPLDDRLHDLIDPGARLAVLEGTSPLHVALHRVARRRGAILVPLHLRAPPPLLQEQVDRAGARSVIAGPGHGDAWRSMDVPGVLLDAEGHVLERRPAAAPDEPAAGAARGKATAGAAAGKVPAQGTAHADRQDAQARIVLQTSGTTGRPRLVTLTERMLSAHAAASAERLALGPQDTWLACLPLYHAGGATLVDRCLRGLGRLRVLDGFEVERVAACLPHVTHVSLVPAQLARLLDAGAGPGALRCVLLGGDHAPADLLERARDAGWPVHPSYGLTEACGQVATALPEDLVAAPGTVGRPLPNVQVRIVDMPSGADEASGADETRGARSPGADGAGAGRTGHVHVRGPTVAAEDWLDTGDLGRLDKEGRLYINGRAVERIVSGGENVDARSVEAVLRAHPSVQDACVVGLPDKAWGQRVAAAVVLRGRAKDEDLQDWCRARLPAHAVPRAWKRVDAVPRTQLGKARRQAIAATWHA